MAKQSRTRARHVLAEEDHVRFEHPAGAHGAVDYLEAAGVHIAVRVDGEDGGVERRVRLAQPFVQLVAVERVLAAQAGNPGE